MVTKRTKVPFGKNGRGGYRGKRLCDCPNSFLTWVSTKLWDTDLHEFAFVSKAILKERETEDSSPQDLEQAADEFLRSHGVNPKAL